MLLTEWNMETALEVRYDEGVAIGEARVLDLMAKGYDVNQIKEILKRKKS